MDLISFFVMAVYPAAAIFGVWVCMHVVTLGVIAAERKAKKRTEELEKKQQRGKK